MISMLKLILIRLLLVNYEVVLAICSIQFKLCLFCVILLLDLFYLCLSQAVDYFIGRFIFSLRINHLLLLLFII